MDRRGVSFYRRIVVSLNVAIDKSVTTKQNLIRCYFSRVMCVAAIALVSVFVARAEMLPFKNYTTADGLGHDRVEEIVRDSRGFLWFCTGEGLARFDGYAFKNYTQADGLPHRRVMDMIETRDGKYLVATYAGVAVLDPLGAPRRWIDTESRHDIPPGAKEPPLFRVFRPADVKPDRRSWTIMDLIETRDGQIYAATLGGFYQLEQSGDDWIFLRVDAEAWKGKELEFLTLLEDRLGGIWIASSDGLFRKKPGGDIELLENMSGGLAMLEDSRGQIWLGGGGGVKGLLVASFPDGQDRPVPTRLYTTEDGLTANDWINELIETSDGRILVGIANAVCEFQPGNGPDDGKFRVTFQREVVSLAEDGGGNLWVGTSSHGAFKVSRRGFTLFDSADFPKPTPFAFNSMFSGSGSDLFLSEHSFDLIRFDGKQFSAIKPRGMTFRSWGWNQIDLRSSTGEWWIASHDRVLRYPNVPFDDLARTDPLGVYTYTAPGMSAKSIFFRLFEDSRGDVWMSLLNAAEDKSGITLLRWDRASDKINAYVPGEHGIPSGNGPTAFAEDTAGNIWIGYYFDGLVRYRDGKFETFGGENGMPSGIVNAIYRDGGGRIWIATGANGLVRVDDPTAEKPRLVNLTVADGLSSNQAACLTEDNFGRIYVGTGRGVTRIEPRTGHIKIYSQADGLPHSYIRTCGRDGEGGLWFTQHKMLARLKPARDEEAPPSPAFIGALRVNGETARKLSELGETSVEGLEFAADERQVQIDFFALGFATGETLRYQYKLTGGDWSEPSSLRTVNLTLSPGTYDFSVRAVNAEGVTSDAPARVAFSIARPVWQRWWFLLAMSILVSLIAYLFYRYRLTQAIKLERVRTRIATDLHDDIGSSLSQIAILSEVARHKAGDNGASEPLMRIADTSREMVDSMSDIVWAINPQKDHVADLVHRMRRFASDTFDAKDIGYTFRFDETAGDISVTADLRREIYLIFKECVNNVAKHSGADRVDISVDRKSDKLVITIEDDGSGFDTASILTGEYEGYGGNGLRNMRLRATRLDGEFEVDSVPGRGTTVRLSIPTDAGAVGIGMFRRRLRR